MRRSIMVVLAAAKCGDDEPQTNADGPSLTLGQNNASVSAAQSAKVFVIRRIAIVRQIIV